MTPRISRRRSGGIPIALTASLLLFATSAAQAGSKEYRLAGVSEAQLPNNAGLAAMHQACQATFGTKARMCTTVEAASSPELADLVLQQPARLQPVLAAVSYGVVNGNDVHVAPYDATGVAAGFSGGNSPITVPSLSCREWSDDTSNHFFTALLPAGSTGALSVTLGALQCQNVLQQVACCLPTGTNARRRLK